MPVVRTQQNRSVKIRVAFATIAGFSSGAIVDLFSPQSVLRCWGRFIVLQAPGFLRPVCLVLANGTSPAFPEAGNGRRRPERQHSKIERAEGCTVDRKGATAAMSNNSRHQPEHSHCRQQLMRSLVSFGDTWFQDSLRTVVSSLALRSQNELRPTSRSNSVMVRVQRFSQLLVAK